MQQYPSIDRTLIQEIVRLGYTQGEIKDILSAIEQNASTAGIEPDDPEWIQWINRTLAAIRRRFQDALNNGQYDALLNVGYTTDEIRDILFTNLLSTTQLLARTAAVHTSGEYQRLHQLGYTDVQIRSLIRASFTVSQLRTLSNRVNDAQRNDVDSQGLTLQQIDDMLFVWIFLQDDNWFDITMTELKGEPKVLAKLHQLLGGKPQSAIELAANAVCGSKILAVQFAAVCAEHYPCVVVQAAGHAIYSRQKLLKYRDMGMGFDGSTWETADPEYSISWDGLGVREEPKGSLKGYLSA